MMQQPSVEEIKWWSLRGKCFAMQSTAKVINDQAAARLTARALETMRARAVGGGGLSQETQVNTDTLTTLSSTTG